MVAIKKKTLKLTLFVLAEAFLLFLIVTSFGSFLNGQSGGNVTVQTFLQVGNVSPEVLSVSINNYASSITLSPNSTVNVTCQGVLRDFNNETNITNVTAEFFTPPGVYGGALDNNFHYRNISNCAINYSFISFGGFVDNNYTALGTCNMSVQYYANPGTWNCTMWVNSSVNLSATGSNTTTMNPLLAVGTPSTINYGTVNQTYVSLENLTNVTNEGNVQINLSLYGYGTTPGDGLAMNCSIAGTSIANNAININYERYNLTNSTAPNVNLNLSAFSNGSYSNLTSLFTVRKFNLFSRQNDTLSGVDDTNATYWRIYVPVGVAGSCNGSIVFGAATANGIEP